MSTIPLAALSIKPPEQTDPLRALGQLAQLKALAQEQQLRGQQIQGAQQQNQATAESLRQTKVLNDAVQKFTDPQTGTTDHDKVMQYMAANGAGKDLITYRTNLASLSKEQQAQEEQRIKTLISKFDAGTRAVQGANDPQSWDAAKQFVAQNISPQTAQQMGDFSPENKQRLIEMGMSAKDYSDYVLRLTQDTRKAPGEKAEAEKKIKENAGTGPTGITADQQAQLNVSRGRLTEEKRHNQVIEGMSAPGGGTEGGVTLDKVPLALRGQVKGILDYRQQLPSGSRNNPRNNALQYWVNALDPTYDATTFPARNKILNEYVKDAGDGQLGAINTALGHLGELNEAAKALSQNDVPLLHSIASKIGAAQGKDAPTTYTMILNRVAPEMTSAYVKGGGGEGERGATKKDFDLSQGAQQIVSNIGESAKLLRSKLASKENNWNNTFKPAKESDKFENRWITPEAKQTLEQLSQQAPGGNKGPAVGTVEGGYRFKGGDPSNKANWEKVQ